MDINSYEEQAESNEVAGFIAKTFEILTDDQFSRIIYWAPSGSEFIIKDANKFQQVVLPRFFRHNKINSFIRQLNMYGFHKSRKEHSKSVFSHPLFLKNREQLLPEIKRKIKVTEAPSQASVENCQSPVKEQKFFGLDLQMTGIKETSQNKENSTPANFIFNENGGSSFKRLMGSQQNFSRRNLNFSLNRVSLNCIEEANRSNAHLQHQDDKDEVISIENGMEEIDQRKQTEQFLGVCPNLQNFENPSYFFTSFILKD